MEFSPLYKSVPQAARRDSRLYELLALVDAIRSGQGRARDLAVAELHARLKTQPRDTATKHAAAAALKRSKRGNHGTQAQ